MIIGEAEFRVAVDSFGKFGYGQIPVSLGAPLQTLVDMVGIIFRVYSRWIIWGGRIVIISELKLWEMFPVAVMAEKFIPAIEAVRPSAAVEISSRSMAESLPAPIDRTGVAAGFD